MDLRALTRHNLESTGAESLEDMYAVAPVRRQQAFDRAITRH
jgi:hypothetical protein